MAGRRIGRPPGELYQITLPFAVFAVEAHDGVVRYTAPIARWAKGKRIEDVLAYYRRRGALVALVNRKD